MNETTYPYQNEKLQSDSESQSWQLSPYTNIFIPNNEMASLHFSNNKNNVFDVARSGKLKTEDISDALSDIKAAIHALKELIQNSNFNVPPKLVVATPTAFLTSIFPERYLAHKYNSPGGKYVINVQEYMNENNLNSLNQAWIHFIDHVIVPRMGSIENRLQRLIDADKPSKNEKVSPDT